MFTGLIQTLGNLTRIDSHHLKIECQEAGSDRLLNDMELGDSIAVDGVCLTVETSLKQGFIATASPETLDKSTLGNLNDGATVNLESSLRVGSKIGGHFVTGHVDGLGQLESVSATETSWELRFVVPSARVARYIVPKGSIAVNGISLTVADCSTSGDWFTVAVIPVTYQETNLQHLQTHQTVNLEGDVLGKYAEKFLNLTPSSTSHSEPDIALGFLAEHGYL
ncbi:MAG: riboflavin synthase [Cyanobacteria bacterium P01_C01_bin.120]